MSDAATVGSGGVDPAVVAQSELAQNMVPTPDDLLADVGPLTQLWYARELCYSVMRLMAASLSLDDGEPLPDDSEPVRALAALTEACGMLDGGCVLVSLLPADYSSES